MLDVQANRLFAQNRPAPRQPVTDSDGGLDEGCGWSPRRKLFFFAAAGIICWGVVLAPLLALTS